MQNPFFRPMLNGLIAGLATLFILVTPAFADDNQGWLAFTALGPVKEDSRLLFWFDAHARFRDDSSDLGVTIVRPGVGWKVNDRLSLWTGVANVISRRENASDPEDHRLWQQATYTIGELFGGKLTARTRLEQRYQDEPSDLGWRLRHLFMWSRPIDGGPWSWAVSNETFIGLSDTDWGQRSGFDQNRLYTGLSYQSNDKLLLNLSYLYNRIDRPVGDDLSNHNLALAITYFL